MRDVYPKYPERRRIPPRSTTSLQWGVGAHALAAIYIRGMSEREYAQHLASGIVEFVERWNIPPTLVLAIMLLLLIWVMWDYWMVLGRVTI